MGVYCLLQILHVWPDQLEAARQERGPEMNEVPEQCVSDFYEWTLLDPSAQQTALNATIGGVANTNLNANTSADPSAVPPIEPLPLSQTMHTSATSLSAQEQQRPGQSHALPVDRAYPFEFRRPIQFKVDLIQPYSASIYVIG